jgi:hypothetical protein
MIERLRIVTQERDGLREQLEGWKKVAQEAEKVRDLALEAKAAAELARYKAEEDRDTMRLCSVSVTRTAKMLKEDLDKARLERNAMEDEYARVADLFFGDDEWDRSAEVYPRAAAAIKALAEANERAANLAVELAAMTLSRDHERKEADTLRRQVEALCSKLASEALLPSETSSGLLPVQAWRAWAAQQAKEGGGK